MTAPASIRFRAPARRRLRSVPVRLMSIGDVLAHLRDDFPDVTISKLRFLEAEGLVDPARTAAGYRKYTTDDVARLRYVLAAQREHYLPLRVIREHLAALDRGEPLPELGRTALSVVAEPPALEPVERRGIEGRSLGSRGAAAPLRPDR